MIELVMLLIPALLLAIVFAVYVAPQLQQPSLGMYQPTDAYGCQTNHRHLWKQAGAFPEMLFDGTVRSIAIFNCPVCTTGLVSLPRIDTTERHKQQYESE